MKATCEQLEAILERQDAAELRALQEHALGCDACALQLRLEREISAAAPGLRQEWDSPRLWPRIQAAIEMEEHKSKVLIRHSLMTQWRLAAAAAVLLAVTTASGWFALTQMNSGTVPKTVVTVPPVMDDKQRLLNEKALADVEKAEAVYMQSIDRLAALAGPKLQKADTALLANYREKLLLIDSAIAEIRAQSENNKFNAHLRKELLSMYQAKQQTLQQVLQEEVR